MANQLLFTLLVLLPRWTVVKAQEELKAQEEFNPDTFNPDTFNPDGPQCPELQPPVNGERKCIWTPTVKYCLGWCLPAYRFNSGDTSFMLKCKNNEWTSMPSFPECFAIEPTNPMHCKEPDGPSQGTIQCESDAITRKCIGTCFSSYVFPDGLSTHTITCDLKSDNWFPRPNFPPCVTVIPTLDDRDCPKPPSPVDGQVVCERNETVINCTAKCVAFAHFPDGAVELTHTCNSKDKRWSPTKYFPDCKRYKKKRAAIISAQDTRFRKFKLHNEPKLEAAAPGPRTKRRADAAAQRPAVRNSDSSVGSGEEKEQLCPIIKPPVAGKVNCSGNAVIKVCIGICHKGYLFSDNTVAKGAFCTRRKKSWTPISRFPPCEPTPEEARRVFEQVEKSNYGGY